MFYLQSAGDVTLVTHLTASRWSQLTRTLHYWEGPVSAAVYYTQEERQQLTESISQAEHYHHRLTVHLIEDSGVSFKKYIVAYQGSGVFTIAQVRTRPSMPFSPLKGGERERDRERESFEISLSLNIDTGQVAVPPVL